MYGRQTGRLSRLDRAVYGSEQGPGGAPGGMQAGQGGIPGAPRPPGVCAAVYSTSGQSPSRTRPCYRDRPAPCFGSRLTQSCTMTTPFTDFAPPAPRVLTIGALEAAINRARAAQPATGAEAVLSREVSVLAKLYGRMIWDREAERPWETLTDTERVAFQLWAAPVGRQA